MKRINGHTRYIGKAAAIDREVKKRQWTWQQLMFVSGIAPLTRSRVTGGKPVSLKTALRVAEALGGQVRDFFSEYAACRKPKKVKPGAESAQEKPTEPSAACEIWQ